MQQVISSQAKKRVNIVDVQLVKDKSILYGQRAITSPYDAQLLFREIIGHKDREHFAVLCVDTKNQPTHFQVVHVGNINSAIVSPREVFKVAILANSASVMFFHNHPSGDTAPSAPDLEITERLKDAGDILGINVLDHIIVGDNGDYTSLAQRGHLSTVRSV